MKGIRKVIIMIELNDGSIRQVAASKDSKYACINHLTSDDGTLFVHPEVMPFTVERTKTKEP